ncbi:MAG: hypothetical protein EOO50_05795 [Flavobacterium sp.]|uniref:hypothetical protein n=1 Tax=Flavobacterium sp. TaxID=239 RepID=UPI0011FA1638|nr:hypothetical protein [Flavobacterium sp.]RZJ67496.1 MAG: hypothetical protein EOO50_05795 [Flavobacterium sp.]
MKGFYSFFLMFVFASCLSQDVEHKGFAFSPGVILQREVFAEANITYGTIVSNKMMIGISGVRVGVESNLKSGDDFTIAPKIGCEVAMTFLAMRATAVHYFQNGNNEFRLVPEVGISMGGAINLTYGYGFRFQKAEIANLSQHRLSLTLNINQTLFETLGLSVMKF